MELKRRVALNGEQLDGVHAAVVIRSVEPADGKESISAVSAAAGYGQRITGYRRENVDMVVKFAINIRKNDMERRAAVLEAVNAWAAQAARERGGAYLTVNYKPDRRLHVVLAQAPGEGSLWDWTKDFTITFRAYGVPYWEQETARSVVCGGSTNSGNTNMTVDGSAGTQADVQILNTSGMTISTVTATVNGQTMTFNNIGLGGNETLVIDHNDGLVRIRIRSAGGAYRSVMDKRSSSSANDFRVMPGTCNCSFTAQRACRMTVSWRARFL